MDADTLIVGQGLCGTWLSFWLQQAGHSFLVIDAFAENSASQVASGVINPVTGRVLAKTWMADSLLPFARDAYRRLGNILGVQAAAETDILHCFPSRQMQEIFARKQPELSAYLHPATGTDRWNDYFHQEHGWGVIGPALLLQPGTLLQRWRQYLLAENRLLPEVFDEQALIINEEYVRYRDVIARRIIFCDGISAMDRPYFNRLPFSPNKGEALLLEVEALPAERIYKRGISLVPFRHIHGSESDRYFWAGSTYENKFADPWPTVLFRERTEMQLKQWLKMPFRVLDQVAAVRPATVERRPFAGMHPWFPRIGLLNGMGTKGCSLAPWFSRQLADHILHGESIQPEASLARFSRLLQP